MHWNSLSPVGNYKNYERFKYTINYNALKLVYNCTAEVVFKQNQICNTFICTYNQNNTLNNVDHDYFAAYSKRHLYNMKL